MINQITCQLLVGDSKYSKRNISDAKIDTIVNVGGKNTKYQTFHLHLKDGPNPKKDYEKVLNYIQRHYNNGKKILVHCRAGISRSPFIIALFLSRNLEIDIDEAIQIVENKHPVTQINRKMLNYYKMEMKK